MEISNAVIGLSLGVMIAIMTSWKPQDPLERALIAIFTVTLILAVVVAVLVSQVDASEIVRYSY